MSGLILNDLSTIFSLNFSYISLSSFFISFSFAMIITLAFLLSKIEFINPNISAVGINVLSRSSNIKIISSKSVFSNGFIFLKSIFIFVSLFSSPIRLTLTPNLIAAFNAPPRNLIFLLDKIGCNS